MLQTEEKQRGRPMIVLTDVPSLKNTLLLTIVHAKLKKVTIIRAIDAQITKRTGALYSQSSSETQLCFAAVWSFLITFRWSPSIQPAVRQDTLLESCRVSCFLFLVRQDTLLESCRVSCCCLLFAGHRLSSLLLAVRQDTLLESCRVCCC